MRFVIYVCVSIILILTGIILLLAFQDNDLIFALGTSFIAGGISSVSFSVIRYLDDRKLKEENANISRKNDSFLSILKKIHTSINANDVTCNKIVCSRNIKKEFDELITLNIGITTKVDMIGLSLDRFRREQLEKLYNNKNTTVRLIVQDPYEIATEIMINQECRDKSNVIKCILKLKEDVEKYKGNKIQLRWYKGAASITLSRVNDTMYVRNRYIDEGIDAPFFFQRINESNTEMFESYLEYFEEMWKRSVNPYAKP